PMGEKGTLLLDPSDIIICQFGVGGCNPAPTNLIHAGGGPYTYTGAITGTPSYIDIGGIGQAGTLLDLLNSSHVTIQTGAGGAGNGDITIAAPIAWSGNTNLTITAARDINLDAAINFTGIS